MGRRRFQASIWSVGAREMFMRAIPLSIAVFIGLGSLGYAQNQPQTLKGVYGPPGSSALGSSGIGASSKSSLGSPLSNAPVGGPPRINVPGDPVQGQILPDDVNPTPIPGRPGYGTVVVNGRRAIVDLVNNRIYQISDKTNP
jgi:hypothetical protein